MKRSIVFCLSIFLLSSILAAQKSPRTEIEFIKDPISFPDHPGLTFRISKPYLRYQKWDTDRTGTPNFSIALEFTNGSDQVITAMDFKVKLLGKKKEVLSEYSAGTGAMTFEPKEGNAMKPGYTGVYDAFVMKDQSMYDKFKKLEFTLTEVKVASAMPDVPTKPIFEDSWLTFPEHPGITVRLSKPYLRLDDLSGEEYFTIAMEFKNESGKPVKFMYFNVTIHDDQGPLYESEIQEHNQKYDPGPERFTEESFPVGYSGIDYRFYVQEKSLFKNFKKIEVVLTKVE